MSDDRDYYRILRVQPDAPAAIVHASYRTLLHRVQSAADTAAAHELVALLNEAYAVLSDPGRRAAYDLRRDVAASQHEGDFDATAVLDPDASRYASSNCLFCGTAHGLDRALGPDDDCRECGSPLYPAERQRLEYSGQRMLRRIPKRRAVDLWVAWPQPAPYPAEMRDISLNGMQLVASAPLSPNQIVKLDCDSCAAIARVAHRERDVPAEPDAPERWSIGLEFLTLRFRKTRGTFVSARA